MRPPQASPRLWQFVSALAAGVLVVLTALQVGSGRESLVVAGVGAVAVTLLAIAVPQWLIPLGAAMAFAGEFSLAGVPLPELGAALIIFATLTMKSSDWRIPGLVLVLVPLFAAWIVFIASEGIGDPVVNTRLLSLTLWLFLIGALALPGRTRQLVARGLLVGLLLSAPAGAVLGSDYGARWAGLAGDPNAFAMVVAITTPIIVDQLRLTRWPKVGVWTLSAGMVILADSRTGMLALATAAVVYALLPRMRAWVTAVPVLALVAANNMPDDLVRGGRWEERAGSDALREEIDAAATRQMAESPWMGHGLGSGKVDLAVYGDPPTDLTFFLHNSYKSMVTEMGLIGLSLYAMLAIGAIVQGLRGELARGALAGIAAAAVMSTQLGEVLFAIPIAMALGFAWGSETKASPEQDEVSKQSVTSVGTSQGKAVAAR